MKFSEIIDAIDSGRTLYAVRSDAYVPISRPQSMIEDMSLKNRYRTRTQIAVPAASHMLLTDDIHQLLPGSEDILRTKAETVSPISKPLAELEKSSLSNSMGDNLPISEKEAIINDSSLSPVS